MAIRLKIIGNFFLNIHSGTDLSIRTDRFKINSRPMQAGAGSSSYPADVGRRR